MTPVPYAECWDRIRPTVELLLADSVEEARRACESGEAVVLEHGEAFIIVSVVRQRNCDQELFVWATAGKGGNVIRTNQQDLRDVARALGCRRIVGRVKNERIANLLERRGWRQTHIEYALEV